MNETGESQLLLRASINACLRRGGGSWWSTRTGRCQCTRGVGTHVATVTRFRIHQVIRRRGESETPADMRHTAELDFAEQSYGLQPAADLFDPFACLFTDRQSPGVAWSDRQWHSSAASGTGRHAGHLSLPQCVHERDDGIVLIAAVGYRPTLCNAFRISCRISLTPA